jgi:hypothetical protein
MRTFRRRRSPYICEVYGARQFAPKRAAAEQRHHTVHNALCGITVPGWSSGLTADRRASDASSPLSRTYYTRTIIVVGALGHIGLSTVSVPLYCRDHPSRHPSADASYGHACSENNRPASAILRPNLDTTEPAANQLLRRHVWVGGRPPHAVAAAAAVTVVAGRCDGSFVLGGPASCVICCDSSIRSAAK